MMLLIADVIYSLLKMNTEPLRIDDLAMAPGPRRGVTSPARAGGPARGGRPGAQYAYAQFAVAADSQTSLRMAESRHDSTAARGTSVCRTFTIAHVNAALLRKELDVVSVCLRTYHL